MVTAAVAVYLAVGQSTVDAMKCPKCGKPMNKIWDLNKGGWHWACLRGCKVEGASKGSKGARGDNPAITPVRKEE